MRYCLVILFSLFFALIPAQAEVLGLSEPKEPPQSARAAPAAVEGSNEARPTLNITQPKLQVRTPTNLFTPAVQPLKTQTAVKKKKKATRRKTSNRKSRKKRRRNKTAKVSEKRWWNKTGNPVVFEFRDCLNQHAKRYAELAGTVSARVHIAQAMDGSCRAEFDTMARTLTKRFGEKGFREMSGELIQTTFLPAAAIE